MHRAQKRLSEMRSASRSVGSSMPNGTPGLSTRAAIAGGLNSEIAFQFSDITIQQIENCSTVNEINMLTYKTTLELCERVAALQKNSSNNPMIDRIVKYIIEAHGGTVSARNDHGLVIDIALPWDGEGL